MVDTNKQRKKYREQGLVEFTRWVTPEELIALQHLYERFLKKRVLRQYQTSTY